MSVIVKNMEMPKECRECPLWEYRHGIGTTWCVPTKTLLAENYMPIAFDGRHPDCPLVEVEDEEDGWIPCSKRLPKCEQEVLICTKKKVSVSKKTGMEWYKESVITPAMYEDGTMLEINSKWSWVNIDYAGWDEEEDCGIIPEGWWENRHFNPDEVYNNAVDKEVIAWMPLPKPYESKEKTK